jgi:hypothetical protein
MLRRRENGLSNTMTTKLTIEQRNNLLVGNHLAAELPSPLDDTRMWIEISAYSSQSTPQRWVPVSKFLNADRSDQRYKITWCEIETAYIHDWMNSDPYIRQQSEVRDLMTIEALEAEIAKYLDDFSHLQLSRKTESPW